jgi:hypothetical protein
VEVVLVHGLLMVMAVVLMVIVAELVQHQPMATVFRSVPEVEAVVLEEPQVMDLPEAEVSDYTEMVQRVLAVLVAILMLHSLYHWAVVVVQEARLDLMEILILVDRVEMGADTAVLAEALLRLQVLLVKVPQERYVSYGAVDEHTPAPVPLIHLIL